MKSLPSKILVATNNRNKADEISKIVRDLPLKVMCLADMEDPLEVEEDGETFEDNAEKKAIAVANKYGIVALADDSGICCDALDGAPGVYSARYGGPGVDDKARYERLLEEMKDIPRGERTARFICVICMAWPEGGRLFFRGECEGLITRKPKGQGGFGYDPVFFYEPAGKTFGEMTPEEKNSVSHRQRALVKMRDYLFSDLPEGS